MQSELLYISCVSCVPMCTELNMDFSNFLFTACTILNFVFELSGIQQDIASYRETMIGPASDYLRDFGFYENFMTSQ